MKTLAKIEGFHSLLNYIPPVLNHWRSHFNIM